MSDLFDYSCIATSLEVILLIIVLAAFPCEVGVLPGLRMWKTLFGEYLTWRQRFLQLEIGKLSKANGRG